MSESRVAVLMGSDSDWPIMRCCVDQLRAFGIEPYVEVISAHRSPRRLDEFATGAQGAGFEVIIAGAGMSAALAGSTAALTCLPVIGVPLPGGVLDGLDALLATVQMPPGLPVATMGPGSAGATNAALLAVQILARTDPDLAEAYRRFKDDQAQRVADRNKSLMEKIQP